MGWIRGVGYLYEGFKLALTHKDVGGRALRIFLVLAIGQVLVLGGLKLMAGGLWAMGWLGKLAGGFTYGIYLVMGMLYFIAVAILSGVVMERLSVDAERHAGGSRIGAGDNTAVGEVVQATLHALVALVIYVASLIAIWFAGLLLPDVVERLLSFLAGAFFTAFITLDYTLNRRKISFGQKTAWLFGRLPVVLSFGALVALLAPIPVLGPAALVLATAGGALLVVKEGQA